MAQESQLQPGGTRKASIPVEESCPSEEGAPKPKPKMHRRRSLHPLEVLLGETLKNAKGEEVSPRSFAVEGAVLGLYFAAHWCPPCRSFCPSLMLLYDELKKRDLNFEVVYVSLDSTESSYNDYLAKMPWYAVPYVNEDKREEIAYTFGIKGIPVLVLLDPNTMEIIAFNGRELVSNDPRGAFFPWQSACEEQSGSVDRAVDSDLPPAVPGTPAAVGSKPANPQGKPSNTSTAEASGAKASTTSMAKRRSLSDKRLSATGSSPKTKTRASVDKAESMASRASNAKQRTK